MWYSIKSIYKKVNFSPNRGGIRVFSLRGYEAVKQQDKDDSRLLFVVKLGRNAPKKQLKKNICFVSERIGE